MVWLQGVVLFSSVVERNKKTSYSTDESVFADVNLADELRWKGYNSERLGYKITVSLIGKVQ